MKNVKTAEANEELIRRICIMLPIGLINIATNLKDSIQSLVSQKNDHNFYDAYSFLNYSGLWVRATRTSREYI